MSPATGTVVNLSQSDYRKKGGFWKKNYERWPMSQTMCNAFVWIIING